MFSYSSKYIWYRLDSIPFKNFDILNISQLFIDPINKPPYYYSFVVGGGYEVTALL
jgi:hypothetical protein